MTDVKSFNSVLDTAYRQNVISGTDAEDLRAHRPSLFALNIARTAQAGYSRASEVIAAGAADLITFDSPINWPGGGRYRSELDATWMKITDGAVIASTSSFVDAAPMTLEEARIVVGARLSAANDLVNAIEQKMAMQGAIWTALATVAASLRGQG